MTFAFSLSLMLTYTAFAQNTGKVNDESVNVRTQPSTGSQIAMKASTGKSVVVNKVEGEFYNISVDGKANLYISTKFVDITTADAKVKGTGINVRTSPSTNGQVLGQVGDGELLTVKGKTTGNAAGWYAVDFKGKTGYIKAEFLTGSLLSNVKAMSASDMEAANAKAIAQSQGAAAATPAPKAPVATPTPIATPTLAPVVAQPVSGPPVVSQLSAPAEPITATQPIQQVYDDQALYMEIEAENLVFSPADLAPSVLDMASISNDTDPIKGIYGVVQSSDGLNLRIEPSTSSEIILALPNNATVDIVFVGNNWHKVKYDDQVGYVWAEFFELKTGDKPETVYSGNTVGEQVVSYAKAFLGTPYVWAGTNLNKGVDCSGYIYSVFKHFGVTLSRSSASMAANNGTRINSKSELQPGDLVFFGNYGGKAVEHVGIYMGGGQFIHAASTKAKRVIISSLSESYYATNYKFGSRVF